MKEKVEKGKRKDKEEEEEGKDAIREERNGAECEGG